MGKLNYKEMKELLERTLDTMDIYNRIIRQLLEDDDDDNTIEPIISELLNESIIPDNISDIENTIIEIESTDEQIEKNDQVTDITSNSKEDEKSDKKELRKLTLDEGTEVTKKFIENHVKTNDPELKNKPPKQQFYASFKRWCYDMGTFPALGIHHFNKILDEVYKPKKRKYAKRTKQETFDKSGIHEYLVTPENIKSIKPLLVVGDVVGLNHEKFGEIAFEVAGINVDAPNTVSLISKDCVTKRRFDPRHIVYVESSVQKWLNDEFLFGLEIVDHVCPVTKKTLSDYGHMRLVKSLEYCWIPSRDELMLEEVKTADIYENSKYPLFVESANRIKKYNGEAENYITRTAYKCDQSVKLYDTLYSKSNYMYKVSKDGKLTACAGNREQGIVIGLCI